MKKITIDAYIEERLDGQYRYYSRAAAKAKRKYQGIKAAEILVAATIPFLSALITETTLDLKIVVGVMGVFVTLFSGMLMLYKYQENWVNFRATAEALKSEKYLFLSKTGPYKQKGSEDFFVERIESILGEEHRKWQQYIIKKETDQQGEESTEKASADKEEDQGSNPQG